MSEGEGDLQDVIDTLVKQITEDHGIVPDVARRLPTVAHIAALAVDPIVYGDELAYSVVFVSSDEADLATIVISEFLVTETLLKNLVVPSTETETSEEDTNANTS